MCPASRLEEAHGDTAAGRRELERIREEIVEHLAEPPGISLDDGHRLGLQEQLDLPLVGGRPCILAGLNDESGDVDRRTLELDGVCVELRGQQEVTDHAQESLAVAADDAEEACLLLVDVAGL